MIGERGEKGDIGERGEQGLIGERGEKGVDGLVGATGEKGDKGEQGAEGRMGPIGIVGEKGDKGDSGIVGPKGEKGDAGEIGRRGEQGPPGLLPLVKEWTEDAVHYQSNVVSYKGGTYQALRDTAKPPNHSDWRVLAARGIDGSDGLSFTVRETYDQNETYSALDIVTLNATWFIAKKNNPGVCPGPDWKSGPTGRKGEKGDKGDKGLQGARGEKGLDGREIIAWDISDYTVTPIMSDGERGAELSARGLFEQFNSEAS